MILNIFSHYSNTQAVEKRLCRVAERLKSVCKCEKPISVSIPPHALESGLTTIIIKREEEGMLIISVTVSFNRSLSLSLSPEQGTSSIQSRLALKVDELQLQHMTCDGMIGQLKTKSEALAESVREEEKALQPLVEEMEAWLGRVQSLLVTEPVRQFHGVDEQV